MTNSSLRVAVSVAATLAVASARPAFPAMAAAIRPTGAVTSLAVDPSDGSLLKVQGGLFQSTDGGRHWQAMAVPPALRAQAIRQLVTTTAAPSRLYAAGPGAGIVRSDDRGQTWRAVSAGLPSQDVGALALHSFRPDTLYVWIKDQGLFRTEDGGARWLKMDDGPPAPVAGLAHSTLEGSMNTGWLYAATREGPFLSMDCF